MELHISQIHVLVGLFFCHFLCDFTHLSNTWMLKAKKFGSPLFPIFIHALVHGTTMGLFLILYSNYVREIQDKYLWFAVVGLQVIAHFFIDVLKGKINKQFPGVQNPISKQHWIVFGFDQYLHALVIILMTYIITLNWI